MVDPAPQPNQLEVLLPRDVATASRRMIRLRWVAGGTVVAATAICVRLLHLPLPEPALYAVGLAILAYNALLHWLGGRGPAAPPRESLRRTRQIVVLQVALDWASIALFLHLTGGISSPAIPFFLIHMLMVTILLPEVPWFVYVAAATAMLGVIALLEALGILPNLPAIPALPPGLYRDPIYILAQVAFFTAAASATVLLTASIMTRLRERERQIAALLQATQAVSSTLSLPEVLQHLARSAAGALSSDRASIRLLDETGERLELAASYGLRMEYQRKGPVELSRSGLDREALAGQAVIVPRAASDARIQYPREVIEEGIGSILVVPILGRRGPLGVLRVYATQPNRFNREDADFVTAIARQGAVAIENALAHQALQKADQDRAQFVRTVTHELRSPVSGAQSLARVLLGGMSGPLSGKQQEVVARVAARLDRLMDLVNDLLALAAAKTVSFREPPEPLPLQAALRSVLDQHAAVAREKQVQLLQEIPSGEDLVRASPDGLALIFGNLIDNAIKYTLVGGRVKVMLRVEPSALVVTVSDTGLGIPKEELPHLWEEFFRATNVRRAGIVGTGLGLSIVKRLVESYGGMIGVQSTEGKGTTFTVTLPRLTSSTLSP